MKWHVYHTDLNSERKKFSAIPVFLSNAVMLSPQKSSFSRRFVLRNKLFDPTFILPENVVSQGCSILWNKQFITSFSFLIPCAPLCYPEGSLVVWPLAVLAREFLYFLFNNIVVLTDAERISQCEEQRSTTLRLSTCCESLHTTIIIIRVDECNKVNFLMYSGTLLYSYLWQNFYWKRILNILFDAIRVKADVIYAFLNHRWKIYE